MPHKWLLGPQKRKKRESQACRRVQKMSSMRDVNPSGDGDELSLESE